MPLFNSGGESPLYTNRPEVAFWETNRAYGDCNSRKLRQPTYGVIMGAGKLYNPLKGSAVRRGSLGGDGA